MPGVGGAAAKPRAAGRAPMTAIYAALARVPSLMAQADGDS